MDQLVGCLLGIAGSILTWWIFAHWLVPNLRFEEKVLIRPSRTGQGWRYFVKVSNRGRRDLIDVTFSAIASIQTRANSDKHWASCHLAFHQTGETEHHVPLLPVGRNRLLTLRPAHSDQLLFEGTFSSDVHAGVRDRSLNLPQLLGDGESRGLRVKVRVYVFGYDRFSGARKLFQSPEYETGDLQDEHRV